MAEVIWKGNRDRYLVELDQMFEQRYEVFFERGGWDPDIAGIERGFDQDEFDTEETVYLIERHSETDDVVASVRLIPTLEPHMMSEVFPHYCDYPNGVPQNARTFELSRVVYDRERIPNDKAKWLALRATFRCALTEFCIRSGIRALTYVVTEQWYTEVQANLWPTQPLGSRHWDKNLHTHSIAAISQMNHVAQRRVRDMLGSDRDVLYYAGPMRAMKLPIIKQAA